MEVERGADSGKEVKRGEDSGKSEEDSWKEERVRRIVGRRE